MLGGVVISGEFVQHVDPVVGSLAVKKFPHHGFQGSVEPFHDGGLFVGEEIYVVTFQEIPNADVVKFFSLVKLNDVGIFSKPLSEFFQQQVDGSRHVFGVLSVDGERKDVPAQNFNGRQYPAVTFVFPSVLSHVHQVQLRLVREVFHEGSPVSVLPDNGLVPRVSVLSFQPFHHCSSAHTQTSLPRLAV